MNKDILEARIHQAIKTAEGSYRPAFVGFLDEKESLLVKRFYRENDIACKVIFFGGFEEAKRVMFGAFPEYYHAESEEFPISAITFSFRNQYNLKHSDFLGTLMSEGIKRDSVGDILTESGRSVVFLKSDIAKFICSQVEKVGGVGVSVSQGAQKPYPAGGGFAEFSGIVASNRADAFISSITGLSREKSAQIIKNGFVSVSNRQTLQISDHLLLPCEISIRGYGKFIILEFGKVTKKGRLSFNGKKYL